MIATNLRETPADAVALALAGAASRMPNELSGACARRQFLSGESSGPLGMDQ